MVRVPSQNQTIVTLPRNILRATAPWISRLDRPRRAAKRHAFGSAEKLSPAVRGHASTSKSERVRERKSFRWHEQREPSDIMHRRLPD